MEKYISIGKCIQRYGKSLSTVKKAISKANNIHKKQGEQLNTGLFKILISTSYMDEFFGYEGTTANTTDNHTEPNENIVNNLLKTISDLTNNNTLLNETLSKIIDNESRLMVLLDREKQHTQILTKHFDRNRTLSNDVESIKEEEIIDEVIQEEASYFDNESNFIDVNNEKSFQDWIKSMKQ
jgi:hypothetical protein